MTLGRVSPIIPGPNILLIHCCYKAIVGQVLPSLKNQVIGALTEFAHLNTEHIMDNSTGGDIYIIEAFVLHLWDVGVNAMDSAGPILTQKVFMAFSAWGLSTGWVICGRVAKLEW